MHNSFHESIPTPTLRTNIKGSHIALGVVVIALVLLFGSAMGIIRITPTPPGFSTVCTPKTAAPYIIQFSLRNAITKAALTTSSTVDVISPGNNNNYYESLTAADPTLSTISYKACQILFFHAYSTAGNGYYDDVFTLTIPDAPSQAGCTGGRTCFDLTDKPLLIYQRTTAANAQGQVGVGCGTFTGRATALSTTSVGAAATTDCSPGSGVRVVNFNIVFTLSGASTCWGRATPYINPIASGVQKTLPIGIWMAINSSNPTVNAPWAAIGAQPTSTTVWRTYFATAEPLCVDQALKPSGTTTVTVTLTYTTTVATRLFFYFQDQQQFNVVDAGGTSNPPTNLGAFSGAGTTTTISANADGYELASGAPTNAQLAFVINIT